MTKRIAKLVVVASLFTLCLPADAQQSAKIPRMGIVTVGRDGNTPGPSFETFRQVLRDRGYAEGKNLALEYRFSEGIRSGIRSTARRRDGSTQT